MSIARSAPPSWPETLTLRWKAGVGDGYGTPLVVGRVVYAFTRRDANEVLTALDADTRRGLWEISYAPPGSRTLRTGVAPSRVLQFAAIVAITGILVHMFLIGTPIALGARRAFGAGRSA